MKNDSLWHKDAVFYELNVRAFFDSKGDGNGDLAGLTQKLDYLKYLGVDVIWLLPIFTSPLKDDGYDIADYYTIHPDFGTLDDFKRFLAAAHQRGLRVITDLVINHTSDQHDWFRSARQGRDDPFHDYYVWSDDDQKYSQTRIIFIDTEESNWTWDESARQFFWHRFYSHQPDLNFDNPKVHDEIFDVVRFWLDLGVDGFRVDAVPYLYEREGTNCENLPETHAFLKKLRAFIDQNYPDRILLSEANQWPEDTREYLGDGDEFHMAFHFPLMPRIYMAICKGDASPIIWALENTPSIPDSTQWAIFLRNHDELTLEMVTEEERQWMWEEYAPQDRMRINLGIRRRLAPLLDNDRQKVELAHSLLLTLPGSPVLYYGDEIGMGDNIWLDDRDGVRTPMQWDASDNAGFSSADAVDLYAPLIDAGEFDYRKVNVSLQQADQHSFLNWLRTKLMLRKQYPAFSHGSLEILPTGNQAIIAFFREYEGQTLLMVHNLAPQDSQLDIDLSQFKQVIDLLDDNRPPAQANPDHRFALPGYAYRWFKLL